MTDSTSSRQFEQTLDLQAPREAVWRALTDGAELARWFAPEASVDPQVGGLVGWKWRDHFDWQQTIEAIEPGKHLRTRYDAWAGAGDTPHPLFVDFRLEGEGGHTTLRVVHSGFGSDSRFDKEYNDISGGWPVELRSLQLYLEQHLGRDRQLVWSRAVVDLDVAGVLDALTAGDALGCAAVPVSAKPGDAFAFSSGGGDHFEGQVVKRGEREFVGICRNHDDGFLRLWVGGHDGATMLWLWLATYGDAPVAGLQERWDGMLKRLFGDHVQEGAAS